MVEIEERIEVAASPEVVWVVLEDPYAVVACVPGAEIIGQREDCSYDAKLGVKFGPTRIGFTGRVFVEFDEPSHSGTITGRGKDGVGGTKVQGQARFNVVPTATGSTITVVGSVEVTGRLATFIEGGARMVAKRLSSEFAQRLAQRLAQPA